MLGGLFSEARANSACSEDELRIERNRPDLLSRLSHGDCNDFCAPQADHVTRLLLRSQLNRLGAKSVGKDPIKRSGIASALQLTQHSDASVEPRHFRDSSSDEVADAPARARITASHFIFFLDNLPASRPRPF